MTAKVVVNYYSVQRFGRDGEPELAIKKLVDRDGEMSVAVK